MPLNAIQLWSPDTCSCVIHLAYDDTIAPESRVFTYVTEVQAKAIHQARIDAKVPNTNISPQPPAVLCPFHTGLGILLHPVVLDENRRKNITLGLVQNAVAAIKLENYGWKFDATRVLQINFPSISLNTNQKNNIQAACDIQFGPNKVKIN